MLIPKLVTTLKSYDRKQFLNDLAAGVVVGIVALPLAIAFAIASGVSPERGLYTAIIAGFLISALGGSRVQIGGPTGAFVVIVAGIVAQHGLRGLTIATIMAGLILIGIGVARLGGVIKFIPYPIVTGFTQRIAVIIFSTQIRDLLGLRPGDRAERVLRQVGGLRAGAAHCRSRPRSRSARGTLCHPRSSGPAISRKIPSPFVALIVATAAVGPAAPAGRNDRQPVRPTRFPAAEPSLPAVNEAMLVKPGGTGHHHRAARRHRVTALGGGGRRHDRRPAPQQHGTGGPGSGQHRHAALRRHPGDRSASPAPRPT